MLGNDRVNPHSNRQVCYKCHILKVLNFFTNPLLFLHTQYIYGSKALFVSFLGLFFLFLLFHWLRSYGYPKKRSPKNRNLYFARISCVERRSSVH